MRRRLAIENRSILRFGLALVLAAIAPCVARSASSTPAMPPFPPGSTVRDSIRLLLLGEYQSAAAATSTRLLQETERLHGRDSRESIEPMLLLAEAKILREGTLRREGVDMIRKIERVARARRADQTQFAQIERLRGMALFFDFQQDSATVHFARSESLYAAALGTEHPEFATALVWHGRALRLRRSGLESTPMFERARAIYERTVGRDDVLWFGVQEFMSTTKHYVFPGGSLEVYLEVVAGYRRHLGNRSPRLPQRYWGLVNFYSVLGQTAEAKRACDAGLAIVEADPDDNVRGAAYIYDSAGTIAQLENDHVRADTMFTKVLDVVTRYRSFDSLPCVFARKFRADSRYQLGRIDEAEADYRALTPVVRSIWGDSSDMMAENGYQLGVCALARGDTATARVILTESAEVDRTYWAREYKHVPFRETGPSDLHLGLCHWLAGREGDAFDLALLVERDSRHTLRHQARTLGDQDALGFEAQREGGLGLALTALLGGTPSSDAATRAFDAVVRSRAVILDAITARHVGARTSRDSVTRAVAESLEVVEGRITGQATRGSSRADPVLTGALQDRRRALTSQLASLAPKLALVHDGESIGLAEVRAALPERTRLVSFVRFARHPEPAGSAVDRRHTVPWYVAFVMDTESADVRAIDIGPASELDGQIERWRDATAGGVDDAAGHLSSRSLGDSLRIALWESIRPEDGKDSRMLIVSDGAVALLSFITLPAPDEGYVLEHSPPIAYLSSERDLAVSRLAEPGRGMLVLADPDFTRGECADPLVAFAAHSAQAGFAVNTEVDSTRSQFRGKTSSCEEFQGLYFSRLTQSRAEARDVAGMAEQKDLSCAVLVGPEASEESFKRFAPGRRIVHVASHGFALSGRCAVERGSRETPLVRAGIALAGANTRAESGADREDGILTAEEVAALDMTGTECVVLSACESGVGEVVTGEGVLGMRRAFHVSGAATLVSTLWRVDDAAARMWVREFYRGLLGQHPEPADAAHQASLAVMKRLRKAGRDPSPALWGAFVVCGLSGGQK